jgi:hypothetical protein
VIPRAFPQRPACGRACPERCAPSLARWRSDVPCTFGDFYAMYGFYGISKSFVGAVDLVLTTPFLLAKPKDWYRWGQTRLKG